MNRRIKGLDLPNDTTYVRKIFSFAGLPGLPTYTHGRILCSFEKLVERESATLQLMILPRLYASLRKKLIDCRSSSLRCCEILILILGSHFTWLNYSTTTRALEVFDIIKRNVVKSRTDVVGRKRRGATSLKTSSERLGRFWIVLRRPSLDIPIRIRLCVV